MSNDLTPVEKRIAVARTWGNRVDTLLKNKKKENPNYSEATFCRTHNLDCGFFNRLKKLRAVPSQKTVDAIESALKKEGV